MLRKLFLQRQFNQFVGQPINRELKVTATKRNQETGEQVPHRRGWRTDPNDPVLQGLTRLGQEKDVFVTFHDQAAVDIGGPRAVVYTEQKDNGHVISRIDLNL